MVAHDGNLMVTGLLATVSVAYVCGVVITRGILVPPRTQNNKRKQQPAIQNPKKDYFSVSNIQSSEITTAYV